MKKDEAIKCPDCQSMVLESYFQEHKNHNCIKHEEKSKQKKRSSRKKFKKEKIIKVLKVPSGTLPDWDDTKKTDVFASGRVLSGGAFGQGKNRKH